MVCEEKRLVESKQAKKKRREERAKILFLLDIERRVPRALVRVRVLILIVEKDMSEGCQSLPENVLMRS